MNKYICSKENCTVTVTDKCLLSHAPIESCPYVKIGVANTLVDKSRTKRHAAVCAFLVSAIAIVDGACGFV